MSSLGRYLGALILEYISSISCKKNKNLWFYIKKKNSYHGYNIGTIDCQDGGGVLKFSLVLVIMVVTLRAQTAQLDCPFHIVVLVHPGGGGTHIFGWTGMYWSNGSLFYKKSLNMGPVSYQKILNCSQLAKMKKSITDMSLPWNL